MCGFEIRSLSNTTSTTVFNLCISVTEIIYCNYKHLHATKVRQFTMFFVLIGSFIALTMVHTTANSCNYGIKEFSILSDSFTAGFAFVNSYCQNIVLADEVLLTLNLFATTLAIIRTLA